MQHSINMNSVNSDWEMFMNNDWNDMVTNNKNIVDDVNITEKKIPKCSEIYISTKTKIAYLNVSINLIDLFWKIEISDYSTRNVGVIKKQMKFNSQTLEEVNEINNKLSKYKFYSNHMIQSIDNPNGRIKFKDVRKVSIGLSKKDLVTYRVKEKGAFYNCFVLILRILLDDNYTEFHVKVFNTGKIEIPGIKTDLELNEVLKCLITILKKYISEDIFIIKEKMETVLINSNFDCGFYINREKLFNILKTVHGVHAVFDPCSYPGIQCRIFFDKNNNLSNTNGEGRVSFMIFRTGSILIVGKCDMVVLNKIYIYIKNILHESYLDIYERDKEEISKTFIKKKFKKQIIIRSN